MAPVRRPRRARDDRPLRARGRSRGRLRRAVALVGRRPRGLLGRDLGVLRRAGLRAVRARARTARDARRAVVPGLAAVLRRALLPRARRRRGGHPPRRRAARALAVDVGRAARADRAHRRRAAAHGRRSGRPRGRLHAEHPRDGRGLPGHRLDRRRVVERRARVRRALGDRPLRADRAQGAPGRRRLPLRRPRPRPQRGRRRHRRGDRRAGRALRLPRRQRLAGGARRPRRAADLRAGAVRPPAVAALQLGHHGPAQADRPQPGRDPARAPEEHAPAPRRAGGRPASSGSPPPAG